jgi:hypothetical protein
VQAIEQEMRVELRPERAQLGFPREHLHVDRPAVGFAALLEHHQEIAHGEREQIQKHAEHEDEALVAAAAGRRRQPLARHQERSPEARDREPHRARQHGGDETGEQNPRRPRRLDRQAARDIPRRQTDKGVNPRHRQRHERGLEPGEPHARRDELREQR